jgi:hypothetical protein
VCHYAGVCVRVPITRGGHSQEASTSEHPGGRCLAQGAAFGAGLLVRGASGAFLATVVAHLVSWWGASGN